MNLRLLIVLVVLAAIALALAGWALEGVRWVFRPARRRPRLATA